MENKHQVLITKSQITLQFQAEIIVNFKEHVYWFSVSPISLRSLEQ